MGATAGLLMEYHLRTMRPDEADTRANVEDLERYPTWYCDHSPP